MKKYKPSETVTFYASIGTGHNQKETMTLESLGFSQSELDGLSSKELSEELETMHEDWLGGFIDMGFYIEGDEENEQED